ncbi:hypothetical protein OSTOST_02711 [Ostertagia ostertagi]
MVTLRWKACPERDAAIAEQTKCCHLEDAFNDYWEEQQADKTISITALLSQQLHKRPIELEYRAAAFNISQSYSTNQSNNNSEETTQDSLIQSSNSLVIDQRLTLPEFHGNSSEFGSFWELIEELVNKQPYSNIRKLSTVLSCCKGDAAICLQMIPRIGDSYENATEQLRDQQMNQGE